MPINCWDSYKTDGPKVKPGDTIIANESEFGLYENREYTVIWTMFNDVIVEIFPGKEEKYSLEYFDFPEAN